MYCTNCGNKIEEQENFCTNCGNKIHNVKNEIVENKENSDTQYTEAKIGQKGKKIINAIWTNVLVGLIVYFGFMTFWFLVNGEFYIPLFLKIVIIGTCVLNFLKSVVLEEYYGKCPYCNVDLKILGDAADCPKCNKRVIVKDSKFYKV